MKPFLLTLFLFPSTVFGYALSEVVSNMENREKEISGLRFDYEQKIRFTTMETESTVHGEAQFAKGGRFKILKKEPEEQVIISDGKNLSIYTPSYKQMWKGPWKGWRKAKMIPKGLIPMNDFVPDLRKNFDLELIESKSSHVIISAVPKDADAGYKLELLVSSQTWIIQEVKFLSETAEVKTLFSRLEINPATTSDLFSIKVPKGVEVIPLN